MAPRSKPVKSLASLKNGGKLILIIILISLAAYGYSVYTNFFDANVKKGGTLYLRTGSTYEDLIDQLVKEQFLKDVSSFKYVAEFKELNTRLKPGAYRMKQGMNNNDLVNLLRSGAQFTVKITFNNIRFLSELAGKLANYLEPDSITFARAFADPATIQKLGFTTETFPALMIPNTYEFYWNTSPIKFLDRMKIEYNRFWNDTRKSKADKLGLTPIQVVTIASIVQEETNKNDEKSRMAGVYINRFKKGWLLQADPTIKFAMGNFMIKRVLTEYLSIDSPYNTYKYPGLPPGPINLPDIVTVDAVLNAEQHDYFYFCAKEDFSGYHNFARSLQEHNRNAARYQSALNKMQIFK